MTLVSPRFSVRSLSEVHVGVISVQEDRDHCVRDGKLKQKSFYSSFQQCAKLLLNDCHGNDGLNAETTTARLRWLRAGSCSLRG